MSRTELIRQWWYLYALVLDRPASSGPAWQEFLEHDAKVAEAGITKLGRPMPRDGAEDLADRCDEIRGKLLR